MDRSKEYDLNQYTSDSSKGCVVQVQLEDSKELSELHDDYLLAPVKIEIEEKTLPRYHLKITDLYNIPIGNVKKF